MKTLTMILMLITGSYATSPWIALGNFFTINWFYDPNSVQIVDSGFITVNARTAMANHPGKPIGVTIDCNGRRAMKDYQGYWYPIERDKMEWHLRQNVCPGAKTEPDWLFLNKDDQYNVWYYDTKTVTKVTSSQYKAIVRHSEDSTLTGWVYIDCARHMVRTGHDRWERIVGMTTAGWLQLWVCPNENTTPPKWRKMSDYERP